MDNSYEYKIGLLEALAYGRKHRIAKKIMQEADKNHDGFLDRAEVQAYYGSHEGPPN